MVGPFSVDMYLASFTQIAEDLSTSAASVQLTLSSFMLGISVGQLVQGALSDRWGRRPILLIALLVFAASSVAMVFAPGIGTLIALRAVQGFSGAACVVISRAIVADLSRGPSAVRALSLLLMFSSLGPLIAPITGGILSEFWGWRGVLATLAGLAVTMLVLAWLFVPESLKPEYRQTGGVLTALRRYQSLLANRRFLLLIVTFAITFSGIMAYVSASPFVGQQILGMSPFVYSLAFAAGTASLIFANWLNASLAGRVRPSQMLLNGALLSFVSALGLALLIFTGTLTATTFIVGAFAMTFGVGLTMSNATAIALTLADAARGSGAALLGSSQFLLGSITSPLVGLWGEHTAVPLAVVLLTATTIVMAGAFVFFRGGSVQPERA